MKTKNGLVKIILPLSILALVLTTVWLVQVYRRPLGPELANNASTATPLAAQAQPAQAATSAPEAAQSKPEEKVCGEKDVWYVLILGSDAGDLRGPKGSDLTRLARVDFPNRQVAIFAFPRDLWVNTAGLGLTDPAIDAAPLGDVFFEARQRSKKNNERIAMQDATNASADMLVQNFSVQIDHYVTIDLTRLPEMVDTIDGVPIDIPAEITDPWIGMVIPAGQQTLDGEQLVAYARVKPDSDFDRIQRNNLLVAALRQKLLEPAVWLKIPELYKQFKDLIVTDLSPEKINNLACLLKEVPEDAIVQDAVKPEWTTPRTDGALEWDAELLAERLEELGFIQ